MNHVKLPWLSFSTAVVILLLSSCTRFAGSGFLSHWERYPDSRWTGPDIWANRLADWEIKNGRLTCASTLPLRTAHLTTRRLSADEGSFVTLVNIRREITYGQGSGSSAGIMLGAGGKLDYRAASLIFHSWGEGAGLYAGIDGEGRVFIRDLEQENFFTAYAVKGAGKWSHALLKIIAEFNEGTVLVSVFAVDPSTRRVISELREVEINPDRLEGNVAIVSDSGDKGTNTFSFSHWSLRGAAVTAYRNRNTGPIVTAQYTLSRKRLKMTAQLMPVVKAVCDSVELQLTDEGRWQTVAVAAVDTPSFTARFSLDNYDSNSDRKYRLVARYRYGNDAVNTLGGIIKHDPVDRDEIKVISLSCIEQVVRPEREKWAGIDAGHFPFTSGLLYPNARLVSILKKQNADLLFFAGDQVYEGASPTAAVYDSGAFDDYLYKWYLWCLTYRDLTTTTPSVTLPDDHDVYQGNLWGCGGIATPEGLKGSAAQDAGGYRMPASFVNMVQMTQSSHLPDPVDPEPAGQGIGVLFTECNIGGVSFAIIEDRKFKSAPAPLLPQAEIVNGWPLNRRWNARYSSDVPGASLLGDRQNKFLESWVSDWSYGTWMKAVLSQTLWTNLATLPDSADSDAIVPFLGIPDSGSYVRGDRIVADFDSDGWPANARNRALRIIRKAFAVHICGDQHLGSTIKYGVDAWGDAGYAIVSPATGNYFPRRWFPPVPGRNRKVDTPEYTGDFEDGFGNKMTVYAVANPHRSTVFPERANELSPGFSLITFSKSSREIVLSNWPVYQDPASGTPFSGWPVKLTQTDNYSPVTVAWLPEITVSGMTDPVIRIIKEYNGEMVYNLRINGNSFQPGVFSYGLYTVEVGDPDRELWQKLEGIQAWTTKERKGLTVSFTE